MFEYESCLDYIKIRFKNSAIVYYYTYNVPGEDHVEKMKELADQGAGLNTYINQYAKEYERKI